MRPKKVKPGIKRPYPSSGSEYIRPHTDVARRSTPEMRLEPVQVWVRCCNKMHPVRITEKGRLQLPAHPNLEGERMMVRMGAKEPRCLQILRLWQGNKPRLNVNPDRDDVYDVRFHRRLNKHLPDELKRAYCGGLKQRDQRYQSGRRRCKVTTPLGNEINWNEPYQPAEGEDERPYWFAGVLPLMAFEKLLMRELMNTPKVVDALRGRKLEFYNLDVNRAKLQTKDPDTYWNRGASLDLSKPWYSPDRAKLMRVHGTLDLTFVALAASGHNHTAEGDLLVARYDVGSPLYRGIVKDMEMNKLGPGATYVMGGMHECRPIYLALTKYTRDTNNIVSDMETELGVLGDKGEWLCLTRETT